MPVERPTFHESWYRVAELHPKLRSTVQISRQHFRGQPWHVVQDHTNNAFFRLAGPAYRFIGLLDGKRSVGEAWNLANEQLGDDAPTQGEVIQVLGQLYTGNLLQAEVPADTHTLFNRYKQRKQREITSYLMNIMFSRIPVFDPDDFLNRWLPLFGWIFSPVGLVVWLFLIGAGVYSLMQVPNWSSEITKGSNGLLNPENLALLYIGFSLIKACHEMGHAISCKKFGKQSGTGGEVHVIGIMFLIFTPVPYVDASSSWALTNKWHRAIVGAAGMWVELAIASVAAIVWANSGGGPIHNFAYNIMFVAGFSTIVFNANPLLRYDGYYILSDLLEIPNLSNRGKDYIYYLVKKYVWNVRFARNPAHGASEKFWLFIYAIASFCMRIVVTFGIMFYLTGVLNGTLIILAAGMAIAGLFTWLFVPLAKFMHYLATSHELSRVRFRAMATSLGALAIVVTGICFVPAPDHARAQGVVEPTRLGMQEIIFQSEGAVSYANYEPKDGDPADPLLKRLGAHYINQGQTIVSAENAHLVGRLEADRAKLRKDQIALNKSIAQISTTQPSTVNSYESAVADDEKMIAYDLEQIQRLSLKAPLSGILLAPDLRERQFSFVRQSDRLGQVVDMRDLIIRVAVAQDIHGMLERDPGNRSVEIRIAGRADILLSGAILYHGAAGTNTLSNPALGLQAGGTISTAADDPHGTKTEEAFFEVIVGDLKLVAPDTLQKEYDQSLPLLIGQRVVVRFNLTPKPLGQQAWLRFWQIFQQKFHQ